VFVTFVDVVVRFIVIAVGIVGYFDSICCCCWRFYCCCEHYCCCCWLFDRCCCCCDVGCWRWWWWWPVTLYLFEIVVVVVLQVIVVLLGPLTLVLRWLFVVVVVIVVYCWRCYWYCCGCLVRLWLYCPLLCCGHLVIVCCCIVVLDCLVFGWCGVVGVALLTFLLTLVDDNSVVLLLLLLLSIFGLDTTFVRTLLDVGDCCLFRWYLVIVIPGTLLITTFIVDSVGRWMDSTLFVGSPVTFAMIYVTFVCCCCRLPLLVTLLLLLLFIVVGWLVVVRCAVLLIYPHCSCWRFVCCTLLRCWLVIVAVMLLDTLLICSLFVVVVVIVHIDCWLLFTFTVGRLFTRSSSRLICWLLLMFCCIITVVVVLFLVDLLIWLVTVGSLLLFGCCSLLFVCCVPLGCLRYVGRYCTFYFAFTVYRLRCCLLRYLRFPIVTFLPCWLFAVLVGGCVVVCWLVRYGRSVTVVTVWSGYIGCCPVYGCCYVVVVRLLMPLYLRFVGLIYVTVVVPYIVGTLRSFVCCLLVWISHRCWLLRLRFVYVVVDLFVTLLRYLLFDYVVDLRCWFVAVDCCYGYRCWFTVILFCYLVIVHGTLCCWFYVVRFVIVDLRSCCCGCYGCCSTMFTLPISRYILVLLRYVDLFCIYRSCFTFPLFGWWCCYDLDHHVYCCCLLFCCWLLLLPVVVVVLIYVTLRLLTVLLAVYWMPHTIAYLLFDYHVYVVVVYGRTFVHLIVTLLWLLVVIAGLFTDFVVVCYGYVILFPLLLPLLIYRWFVTLIDLQVRLLIVTVCWFCWFTFTFGWLFVVVVLWVTLLCCWFYVVVLYVRCWLTLLLPFTFGWPLRWLGCLRSRLRCCYVVPVARLPVDGSDFTLFIAFVVRLRLPLCTFGSLRVVYVVAVDGLFCSFTVNVTLLLLRSFVLVYVTFTILFRCYCCVTLLLLFVWFYTATRLHYLCSVVHTVVHVGCSSVLVCWVVLLLLGYTFIFVDLGYICYVWLHVRFVVDFVVVGLFVYDRFVTFVGSRCYLRCCYVILFIRSRLIPVVTLLLILLICLLCCVLTLLLFFTLCLLLLLLLFFVVGCSQLLCWFADCGFILCCCWLTLLLLFGRFRCCYVTVRFCCCLLIWVTFVYRCCCSLDIWSIVSFTFVPRRCCCSRLLICRLLLLLLDCYIPVVVVGYGDCLHSTGCLHCTLPFDWLIWLITLRLRCIRLLVDLVSFVVRYVCCYGWVVVYWLVVSFWLLGCSFTFGAVYSLRFVTDYRWIVWLLPVVVCCLVVGRCYVTYVRWFTLICCCCLRLVVDCYFMPLLFVDLRYVVVVVVDLRYGCLLFPRCCCLRWHVDYVYGYVWLPLLFTFTRGCHVWFWFVWLLITRCCCWFVVALLLGWRCTIVTLRCSHCCSVDFGTWFDLRMLFTFVTFGSTTLFPLFGRSLFVVVHTFVTLHVYVCLVVVVCCWFGRYTRCIDCFVLFYVLRFDVVRCYCCLGCCYTTPCLLLFRYVVVIITWWFRCVDLRLVHTGLDCCLRYLPFAHHIVPRYIVVILTVGWRTVVDYVVVVTLTLRTLLHVVRCCCTFTEHVLLFTTFGYPVVRCCCRLDTACCYLFTDFGDWYHLLLLVGWFGPDVVIGWFCWFGCCWLPFDLVVDFIGTFTLRYVVATTSFGCWLRLVTFVTALVRLVYYRSLRCCVVLRLRCPVGLRLGPLRSPLLLLVGCCWLLPLVVAAVIVVLMLLFVGCVERLLFVRCCCLVIPVVVVDLDLAVLVTCCCCLFMIPLVIDGCSVVGWLRCWYRYYSDCYLGIVLIRDYICCCSTTLCCLVICYVGDLRCCILLLLVDLFVWLLLVGALLLLFVVVVIRYCLWFVQWLLTVLLLWWTIC